jgi:hypothetical protein
MAYTIAKKTLSCYGGDEVVILSCSADAATQNIDTGLDYVWGFAFTPLSMATANTMSLIPNKTATAVAAPGYIGVSGLANNDQFMFIVFGKGR